MHLARTAILIAALTVGAAAAVPLWVAPVRAAPATAVAPVAPATTPAPHKAIYSMTMVQSKQPGQIVSVAGRMYYEWRDGCDAWTTDQKFALDYVYAEQNSTRFNSHYTAWESKAGNDYSFAVKRTRDGELVEEYRGTAKRAKAGIGTAKYVKPEAESLELPNGFFFPTSHTLSLIRKANEGQKIFNAQMFDGSDGEGAVEVNAVLGPRVEKDPSTQVQSSLIEGPARRVRMAFWGADPNAALPEYEMTLTLHDNGVVSGMRIDYDDFSIQGRLTAIDALPAAKCK
ncbi:MAG: hypothetical protein JWM77_3410 [Rhodospirillales bacterium]|nr:hypothetical protein [Rhodospirillales bacterium]